MVAQSWNKVMTKLPNGKYKDLSGKTRGIVKIHKYVFTHDNYGAIWYCTYKSGRGVLISVKRLNSKDFNGKKFLSPIESSYRRLRQEYKHRDKQRYGGNFNISPFRFRQLVSKRCHYCGSEPESVMKRNTKVNFNYNGLDRIENDEGYTLDNVVPCCRTCNIMKSSLTFKEFKEQIKKINDNFVIE